MCRRVGIADKKPEAKIGKTASPIRKPDFSQPSGSSADRILFLQRTIGNKAVERMIRSGTLQAKLRIGQPGDEYEQEADRVAAQIMRMTAPRSSFIPNMPEMDEVAGAAEGGEEIAVDMDMPRPEEATGEEKLGEEARTPAFFRKAGSRIKHCPLCNEDESVQRKAASSDSNAIPSVVPLVREGGRPLDASLRAFFEPRFGYSFDQVRIHSDAVAAESARMVRSLAYTIGHNIVFDAGQYAPESTAGRQLIAHELAHVVQQNAARALNGSAQFSMPRTQSMLQRWHVDGPSNPSLNTIVCNGSGDIAVQMGATGNADQTRCLSDCIRRHEGSHRSDALAANATLCQGQANSSQVLMDGRAEQSASEIRASNVEITCLRNQLRTADATCRPIINARITQMEAYRDSFK